MTLLKAIEDTVCHQVIVKFPMTPLLNKLIITVQVLGAKRPRLLDLDDEVPRTAATATAPLA